MIDIEYATHAYLSCIFTTPITFVDNKRMNRKKTSRRNLMTINN